MLHWISLSSRVLAAGCALLLTAPGCSAGSDVLEGAWHLEGYRMGGQEQEDLSGLMLAADGRIIVIYTMRDGQGGWSGRAHAGPYKLEGEELEFDIALWPEVMDGVAQAAPPVTDVIRIAAEADALEFRFASGSVQRWSRIRTDGAGIGTWRIRQVGSADGTRDAEGWLLGAAGRFALVYRVPGPDDGSTVQAYGGTSLGQDGGFRLQPKWAVRIDGARGIVAHGGHAMTLETTSADSARIAGPEDHRYELVR